MHFQCFTGCLLIDQIKLNQIKFPNSEIKTNTSYQGVN